MWSAVKSDSPIMGIGFNDTTPTHPTLRFWIRDDNEGKPYAQVRDRKYDYHWTENSGLIILKPYWRAGREGFDILNSAYSEPGLPFWDSEREELTVSFSHQSGDSTLWFDDMKFMFDENW